MSKLKGCVRTGSGSARIKWVAEHLLILSLALRLKRPAVIQAM